VVSAQAAGPVVMKQCIVSVNPLNE
jgi:hypothetical protein